MDKKRSVLNVSVSITFKILILLLSVITRRCIIQNIGNEVNGLNSLYNSIIGILSVVELGVGSAISFCMYRPIIEGNNKEVSALYCLFKKIYFIVGAFILAGSLCILPFLKYLVKDYNVLSVDIYGSFMLMSISTVITYLFSANLSLIDAYKNNYITTTINSTGQVVQYLLQILVLIKFKSYYAFLLCMIFCTILRWVSAYDYTNRHYCQIVKTKATVEPETKNQLVKLTKAMFMHKIGSLFVNTIDSLVISIFIGVELLGKYSNYTSIVVAMSGVISLFFSSLQSVIGHAIIEEEKTAVKRYFDIFYIINYILGVVFFLGYYAVIDDLVVICFGSENLILSRKISMVVSLNYFIQFMRSLFNMFRDASGTFYYDRYKPLFESICNLTLSILLVKTLPQDYAVVGVIIATIFTNLFICHIVEPYVVYKHILETSPTSFYAKNYTAIAFFTVLLFVFDLFRKSINNHFISLICNGLISLCFSLGIALVILILNKEFRQFCLKQLNTLISKFHK